MYSNPRAHRVGRLLAFLIEPFILALAYAHIARHRICDTSRLLQERVYTYANISIIVVPLPYSPYELRISKRKFFGLWD